LIEYNTGECEGLILGSGVVGLTEGPLLGVEGLTDGMAVVGVADGNALGLTVGLPDGGMLIDIGPASSRSVC